MAFRYFWHCCWQNSSPMALLLAQTQTQTHESKTEFPVHTEEDILEHNVAVDWHSQSHMALAYLSPQAPPSPPCLSNFVSTSVCLFCCCIIALSWELLSQFFCAYHWPCGVCRTLFKIFWWLLSSCQPPKSGHWKSEKPSKIRSFWHQRISGSSFRCRDIAIRIFCDGRSSSSRGQRNWAF